MAAILEGMSLPSNKAAKILFIVIVLKFGHLY